MDGLQPPQPPEAAELNTYLRTALAPLPGVYVVDQAALADELGSRYLDQRARAITGFALSDLACLETARQIGLGWLPAAFATGVRAIIVDLDGTLYEGVLGEDGPSGIRILPGHQVLARRLLESGSTDNSAMTLSSSPRR